MKHPGAVLLFLAPALLTACPQRDEYTPPQQPGYPPQGQWAPQQGTVPQQGSSTPPGYTPPGQWTQPAPAPAPAPWWQPQPGTFTFPFPFPTSQPPAQGQTPQLPTFPGIPGLPTIPTPFAPDSGQQCVTTINDHRATLGLPALQRWAQSETCAASQARDGAATGQPHGAFGRCSEQGQNVCPAWPGPEKQMIAPCIQSMWNEGPGADFAAHGHYLNLASARFTRVACGFYTAPSGQVSLVQDFL